jgi:hypothetical protein
VDSPGGKSRSVLLRELLHVVANGLGRKPVRDPEGPRKGSATKGEVETLGRGMQVRAPAWCPARRIGSHGRAGPQISDDHSQQILLGGPLATSDARAHGHPGLGMTEAFANHRRQV